MARKARSLSLGPRPKDLGRDTAAEAGSGDSGARDGRDPLPLRGLKELLDRAKRAVSANPNEGDDESWRQRSYPAVVTAGHTIDPSNPRRVMGGPAPPPDGVFCGGCQSVLSNGHRPGCPELSVGVTMFAGYEGEKCEECGRPTGHGHDADCNVMLGMFGMYVND